MRAGLLMLVVIMVVPLAGCGVFGGPDAEDVATTFARAVAEGDARAAGRLTDDPAAATELVRQMHDALSPERVRIAVHEADDSGDTATASFTATWNLGRQREWRYDGRIDLGRSEDGWSVRWRPAVLHPRLAAQQRVRLIEELPEVAPVVDRAGTPLLTAQTVVSVALDPQTPDLPTVTGALADSLQTIDPAITRQSIMDGARQTPRGQRYTVAVLREVDYLSVRDEIYELPGVTFPTQERLLGPDRDFASQLLPGIRSDVEEQLAGAAGWRVVSIDAVGTEVDTLVERAPRPAPRVTTTMDQVVQAAAEDAVEPVDQPAVLVALQPSTGDILAVAQNAPADEQGSLALTGLYPPGSTFKVATATAALLADTVQLETPVDCPATTTIETRRVPNINLFELGTVPFRTAFARSCNTTFARLASEFEPSQLTDAAFRLGIGADFDIPGITTLTGEVPPSDSVVQRAENGFGQGQVLTSPFGLALMASTVAAGGRMPTPSLVRGSETELLTEPARPLPAEVTDSLRVMMRQVITQGTGAALENQGELHGKTGTAEFSATGSHGWFVGFRGDLALAALVVNGGTSAPAVGVAGRLLAALNPS